MKGVFLFCTKLTVYLIELPLMLLLWVVLQYNHFSEELLKFYPLIVALCLFMLFVLVYFFRAITVSNEEIRYHGLFSSRDRALISKDKTLILTMRPLKRLDLELWGNDGTPAFDWQTPEEAAEGEDLRQFSGRAIGGKGTAKKILKYFDMPEELLEEAVTNEGFSYEDEFITVTNKVRNECFDVIIKFNKTII